MKKAISIIGARPQFIKCSILYNKLKDDLNEIIVHTGQHYDENMSGIFFNELDIPYPDYNLNIGSGSHGEQTSKMLLQIERVLLKENPDMVIVYGDTNSTIAGALAAVKLQIPVVHVEAGLRSFNRIMPEEINRVLTDNSSDLLFAPTETAMKNLMNEGLKSKSHLTGDIMYDAILKFSKILSKSNIINLLELNPKEYFLLTLHRPYNVDDKDILNEIIKALGEMSETIVFPVHPRTKKMILNYKLKMGNNIKLINPVGYIELIELEKNAKKIITDSGGIQKEAYFLNVPCVTLRPETEWIETLKNNKNILIKNRGKNDIIAALKSKQIFDIDDKPFGDGDSAGIMRKIILDYLN